MSIYLDHHLQPLAQSLPSYIQDSTDFINKLSNLGEIPDSSYLVTMDVSALYPSIPQEEGIKACRAALDNRSDKSPPTDALVSMLKLTLESNNFTFNGENYLQISGTAIGAKFAPPYAIIFMGWFEEKLLRRKPNR